MRVVVSEWSTGSRSGVSGEQGTDFDREGGVVGAGALPGWRRADFEAPAAVGVARVRRAPIEPEEERLSIEQVSAAHALLSGCALRRGRATALDIAHAGLVDGALGRAEHDVVRVADGLEDVHAADARLLRDVHGPVWQLRAVDHHFRETRLRRRLVPFLHGQRP